MEFPTTGNEIKTEKSGIDSPEQKSSLISSGVDAIERSRRINILRDQIESTTDKIANLRRMLDGMREGGMDVSSFETKLAAGEDELERRIMQLKAYELGETEITGEVVADKKDLPERIKAELKRRDQEKEQAEKDEKDMERLLEYEQLLEKVKAEFLKLKVDLDHEKSEWEEDYNAPELDQRVKELKVELEENLKGGFLASFKKEGRRKKAQECLDELKALENNYSRSCMAIYNRWLDFNNKTVEKVRLENDDLNLTLIGEHMLFDRDKDSEIGIKMARIRKETDELISEIKMEREKYDLHYDESRILSKKEMESYEARIAALA